MYKPKTTSPIVLYISLLFFVFGIMAIAISLPNFSPFRTSIIPGTILDTSFTPRASFQYENKTYTIQANYSSNCNNNPCHQTGDTAYILVNENNPQESIFLTHFLILLIFPLVAIVGVIGWTYIYRKSLARKKIIDELISLGAMTDAVILDMHVIRSKNKNGSGRVIGYQYMCRDIQTENEYLSETIPNSEFEIGSIVKVVHDELRYPGIYWVDFNTVRTQSEGDMIAAKYYENKIVESTKELRKELKGKGYTILGPIFGLGVAIFFFSLAIFVPFFPFHIVGVAILYYTVKSIPYALRARKLKKIRAKNISTIATIVSVEKVGKWKTIPLGYLHEEDIASLKSRIKDINDGESVNTEYPVGYPYQLQVSIGGVTRTTEMLIQMFPVKYAVGAKIRLYFNDMSFTGDFMTDIESVDELN